MIPCPNCPDGNEWGPDGPTGRTCRTCGGHAALNLDGSKLGTDVPDDAVIDEEEDS